MLGMLSKKTSSSSSSTALAEKQPEQPEERAEHKFESTLVRAVRILLRMLSQESTVHTCCASLGLGSSTSVEIKQTNRAQHSKQIR